MEDILRRLTMARRKKNSVIGPGVGAQAKLDAGGSH